jgi:hypothetical protein
MIRRLNGTKRVGYVSLRSTILANYFCFFNMAVMPSYKTHEN